MSRAGLVERYGPWAVVTGASSGIGEAFAEALARHGVSLVLVARREERLAALAERLGEAHGIESVVSACDLTRPDAIDAIGAATGGRDVGLLVNNAGFGFNGNFLGAPSERYGDMIALNCAAPVRLTHRLLPAMLRRKRGAIIVVGSTASYQPVPYLSVYAATKAFDLIFGEALHAELRGTGVDVLTVCPGLTKTEFAKTARMGFGEPRGADPRSVADAALRRLGRRMSFIHGVANKVAPWATRFTPRSIVARVAARAMPPVLFKRKRADFVRELERLSAEPATERQPPQ